MGPYTFKPGDEVVNKMNSAQKGKFIKYGTSMNLKPTAYVHWNYEGTQSHVWLSHLKPLEKPEDFPAEWSTKDIKVQSSQ